MIYQWLENSSEKSVARNTNRSKKGFSFIKKLIIQYINSKEENLSTLGGKDVLVQVDETAICHGLLSMSPSTLPDETQVVTWLVGIIEARTRNIRFEIVPNRSSIVFEDLFKKYLCLETTVITDGHKSYTREVASIKGIYKIVNHSVWFKNEEGFHTNNIENL